MNLFSLLSILLALSASAENHLDKIKLPNGFKIETFIKDIENPRQMVLGDAETLFVGSRSAGKVYGVKNGKVHVIATDLSMPVGVAFLKGDLYVSEVYRILKFEKIEARLQKPPKPKTVIDSLPKDRHHGWKFIAFGPDGKLYVPVGAPCNICERKDNPQYASILRMDPNGKNLEIFASGVRNSVGFDWHPQTKKLYFTDNGRDWLGDDLPPDELNTAAKPGLHFGYPYCHGKAIRDPEFGKKDCKAFEAPLIEMGAHVAALGMRFYTGKMFPKKYRGKIFIAQHGSWNRTRPSGYQIVLADPLKKTHEVFASGWIEKNGKVWGRPADVLVLKDGSLLVSDDFGNGIYRISYGN